MASFTIYKDTKSEYRWRFRANNGKIVADSSEGYGSKDDCKRGIEIVKTEGPNATVTDTTT